MPDDPPFAKVRRPLLSPVIRSSAGGPAYAELHCKTNFSFLEGASHPDELVQTAVSQGYRALAITDRHSVAGVVRAYAAARETGLKLLIGAEITPDDAPPVILLATDRPGYGNLCRLLTTGRLRAAKGECRLTFADIASFHAGLLAGVLLKNCLSTSWPVPVEQYRELFGDRCYGLAALHLGPRDDVLLDRLQTLATQTQLPLVASNDVHYHGSRRRFLHDVVTAIRHRCTVAELGHRRFPNGERYLKSPRAMGDLFAACPDAVARTVEVADRCTFSLAELRYDYPEELCPPGTTPMAYLRELTAAGAARRYPTGIPDKVQHILTHELQLIDKLQYESYFLTVWDLVQYARRQGILCQGRGSAANSAVCYCLEVTSVDPDQIDVLFERFVSEERDEAPDIDVDFEHQHREIVLQYLYDKYGRERAGMTATVITYRPKSAVRDVGKALGLSLDRVDGLSRIVGRLPEGEGADDALTARLQEAGLNPTTRTSRQLIWLVREILGFPRHLSQHVGGMVITQHPLCEMAPLENAAMPGRTVIPWDKDDLDVLGILKVDCLALGMLTALHRSFDLLRQHTGRLLTLDSIPQDDPAVYAMIRRAETVGVFQIESRAQMASLPLLKPRTWYDLVIQIAIIRPGPIQGDMVHPYRRRRQGDEPVTYPDQRIRDVLHKTLGVPLFQEQAMRLAMVAAGFTPGEADRLRRAMAAWRRAGTIDQFRDKLLRGMAANGYDAAFGERLFQMLRGFGQYGFPESHAASFARLAYASAWLKCHHPEVFTAALLNSQPMGFYGPAQLVRDARRQGVVVRPVDVNHSDWDCTLEHLTAGELTGTEASPPPRPFAIRLGLRMINGLAESHAAQLVACREQGPFTSVADLARRTGLGRAVLATLARADACGSLSLTRRQAAWQACVPYSKRPPAVTTNSAPAGSVLMPSTANEPSGPAAFGLLSNREAAPAGSVLMPSTANEPSGSAASGLLSNREAAPDRLAQSRRSSPSLFDMLDETEEPVALPAQWPIEEVAEDYQSVGLSLRQHPLSFLRQRLQQQGVLPADQLVQAPADGWVRVGGLVIMRQRPSTAKGVTFVTLEDETGTINLIVWQQVWERYRRIATTAGVLLASGPLQRQQDVIHVLVHHLEDASDMLREITVTSRNFR